MQNRNRGGVKAQRRAAASMEISRLCDSKVGEGFENFGCECVWSGGGGEGSGTLFEERLYAAERVDGVTSFLFFFFPPSRPET